MAIDFLFHDVDWVELQPRLRVSRIHASPTLEYLPLVGSFLGFRRSSTSKHCLGYFDFSDMGSTYWVPCATGAWAERGVQCDECRLRDPFTALHSVHRGGQAKPPAGLTRYVSQPHWLYMATFGDGASKVGTAADTRKFARVREQGAILVTFIAHARDGRIVRFLEDGVSATGLVTQGRSKEAKLGGILAPLGISDLRRMHDSTSAAARDILQQWRPDASSWLITHDSWESPYLDELTRRRSRYPLDLTDGPHGLDVKAAWGSAIACTVRDEEDSGQFGLELSPLRGHVVSFGDYRTQFPNFQMSLF